MKRKLDVACTGAGSASAWAEETATGEAWLLKDGVRLVGFCQVLYEYQWSNQ
jgi:hypothetical protein